MARILLTEDDEAVRSFVKRALELDGHSVDASEDGGEAVEKGFVGVKEGKVGSKLRHR